MLAKIAENGHVMTLASGETVQSCKNMFVPTRVGINDASTMPLFCGNHDSTTFRDLETPPFVPTVWQAFLVLYRAISHELLGKAHLAFMHQNMNVIPKSDDDQAARIEQSEIRIIGRLAELGAKELARARGLWDQILLNKSTSEFDAIEVRIKHDSPVITCAGIVSPYYAFAPSPLQSELDLSTPLKYVGIAIVPVDQSESVALIGWHKADAVVGNEMFKQLEDMPNKNIPECLVRFAIANTSNVYIRQSWWESRNRNERRAIVELCKAGVESPTHFSNHVPNSQQISPSDFVCSKISMLT